MNASDAMAIVGAAGFVVAAYVMGVRHGKQDALDIEAEVDALRSQVVASTKRCVDCLTRLSRDRRANDAREKGLLT